VTVAVAIVVVTPGWPARERILSLIWCVFTMAVLSDLLVVQVAADMPQRAFEPIMRVIPVAGQDHSAADLVMSSKAEGTPGRSEDRV
jgi:hypothetical protein